MTTLRAHRKYAGRSFGFTLLETLIYVALFTIAVGGGLFTAMLLIQSNGTTAGRIAVESEGDFIVRKLDWAITGSTLVSPTGGASSTVLRLARDGTTYEFSFAGNAITLARNGGSPVTLTTANADASDARFWHIPATGSTPEGVGFSFALEEKSFGPKIHYFR